MLLTGIHLMRTGEVQANLGRLNESFKLAYLPELIERKVMRHEVGGVLLGLEVPDRGRLVPTVSRLLHGAQPSMR